MPRSPEVQKRNARERYGRYRVACSALGLEHAGIRWSSHLGQLELHYGSERLTALIDDHLVQLREEALREGVTREGEPGYFGVFCITCREDCLPLDELGGICGWCGRIPATGVYADSDEAKRATWRRAKQAQRGRERAVA